MTEKVIYKYDPKAYDFSVEIQDSEYTLQTNETTVVPDISPAVLENGQWRNLNETEQGEYDEAHKDIRPEKPAPTVSGEMLAINALGMQVAQIQAKLTTTNGGAS